MIDMMSRTYTMQEAMMAYNHRSQAFKQIIRRVAAQRLRNHGFEEIGTSDIHHEICNMCNEYHGDFDQLLLHTVEAWGAQ